MHQFLDGSYHTGVVINSEQNTKSRIIAKKGLYNNTDECTKEEDDSMSIGL